MADFITSLTSVFTAFMDNIGSVASEVVDTPLLLFGACIPIAGAAIGGFHRLLKRR